MYFSFDKDDIPYKGEWGKSDRKMRRYAVPSVCGGCREETDMNYYELNIVFNQLKNLYNFKCPSREKKVNVGTKCVLMFTRNISGREIPDNFCSHMQAIMIAEILPGFDWI